MADTPAGYFLTAMLAGANVGFLTQAPENVKQQFPQFKAVESHSELLMEIKEAMAGRACGFRIFLSPVVGLFSREKNLALVKLRMDVVNDRRGHTAFARQRLGVRWVRG